MRNTLIITGWGWKEYAVAAAAALRALKGDAEVIGMSKRRLPEFLEAEGAKWKRVFLIGLSLAGDEARLATALKRLGGAKRVTWISGLPMSESQRRLIAPHLKVLEFGGGPVGGAFEADGKEERCRRGYVRLAGLRGRYRSDRSEVAVHGED